MEPSSVLRLWYSASEVCSDGAWGEELKDSHSSPLSSFKESSEKGCVACTMLLGVVDEFLPNWAVEDLEAKKIRLVYEVYTEQYENPALGVYLEGVDEDTGRGSFQLLCRSKDDNFYPPYYETRTYRYKKELPLLTLAVAKNSCSEAAFERASKWLSFCVENDPGCKATQSNFKPRRLISVASSKGPQSLRLYEPESPATYACLSYCWGADLEGVLKTTKENLLQQLEGIDIASLPKTIADAVTVCRGLNIANLWVDSLCIIQDDLDDWLSQSSQMLDIYAKSYVTIYAKEASSCKLGFLGPQRYGDRRWQRPIKTPVPPELALPGDEFYIRDNTCYSERPTSPPDTHGNPSPNRTINLGDDEFIVQSNDESHSEEPTFPLDTRGWCLQENLLPNRKLFYDGNEMSWECCTRRICECGHWTKMDLDPWNSETLLSFKDMLGLAKISSSNRHTRQGKTYPLEHWEEIVMAYSRRNLTMFEDKLTAISGLAKLFAQATEAVGEKDPYHGGLWASRFITGLSWQTSGAKRPVEYSAPTWSWASVDGPITRFKDGPMCYPDRVKYRRKHVRIDEVVCEPVLPSDKLGRIKGGYAIVTGPVVEVELVTLGEGWDSSRAGWLVGFPDLPFSYEGNISMVRSRNLQSCEVHLDFETGPVLQGESKQSTCWANRACSDGCCKSSFPAGSNNASGSDAERGKYACLRLFNSYGHSDEPVETCFLVLQKRRSGDASVYNRVGIGFSGFGPKQYPGGKVWEDHCPLFEGCKVETVKIE